MAQQTRIIKGIILDEKSEPVIGASISVQGTKIGAITDLEGKFILTNLPANQKDIQISYLGYKTQLVDITGKTEISVSLVPSTSELDEVVVVGYGTQKKAHLTGSIATVKPSDITDLSVTSLSAALQGLMTGVSVSQSSNRPGEPARISIRQQDGPLYVIDGYVCPADDGEQMFNNLDPTMVENISVIKDAAAAVYGSRSGSGVVLVTTKRGQISKPKISYSGQYGYTDEFYRSKMMDSYNFGLTWNAVRMADANQGDIDHRRDLFQADELEAMKSLNYDLLDKYWSSALAQKHSVNVSGGNESATFFAGISYITQGGNMGHIDYNRWNYNAGVDTKINKWTKASLRVSGDYGTTMKSLNKVGGTNTEKDYVMLLTRPRYIPEYITDNNGKQLPVAPFGITNSLMEQTQVYNFNEIENMGNFIKSMPQNMVINGSLDYDFGWSRILKGLKLQVTYTKSIGTTKGNEYGSEYTLYRFPDNGRGGSGNHLYVGTDGYPLNLDNITTITAINGSSGYLNRSMSRTDSYQANFIATYARTFGLHNVSGLFTIEKGERELENLQGNVTLPYTFTNLQSNGASGDQTTTFSRSESGSLSYVGRLNYAYADKYLAEFLVRSDASTKFAPVNYWGIFPSLSLGWVLSEESWFKNKVQFIDFLKIRGSFGLLGRDNVTPWAWAMFYGTESVKGPIFGSNPSLNAGAHFQMPTNIPNYNSHWDKAYKSNLGLDINFLKNRLSVNLEGYYEKYRDEFEQITNTPDWPSTVGAPPSDSNYGADDKYGIELSLGWKDNIGKDIKYYVKLNTGYTDDKVIIAPFSNVSTRALDEIVPNERSDRGLWGYECIGMFRSNQEIAEYFAENNLITYMGKSQSQVQPGMLIYKNVRGSQKSDGTFYAPNDPNDPVGNVIDSNDRIKISNRSNNIYGFTLNFGGEWKSLSLSAQLGASWGSYTMMPTQAITTKSVVSTASGYDVMQYTNLPSFWSGNMFNYQDVLDVQGNVVSPQNLNAKYPNLRFADVNSVASTFWRVSNTNVMLRNITLAYALPKLWTKVVGIESCRINVTGQNVVDFYNPYPDKFMSQNSPYSTYPLLRKITLGLNVSF